MEDFFFDFETRSKCDLRTKGAVKYALHESTEATLLTWAIGNSAVKVWRYDQPIPQEIIQVASNPQNYTFIAHNVEFDYLIWNFVYKKLMPTMVRTPVDNLRCTQAMGQRFCAGRGLDSVAQILHLPMGKDNEGRRVMLKQCKPNSKGVFPVLTEVEWDIFIRYGKTDTDLLRQAYRILPPLSPAELWAWRWTFKMNLKGLRVDMKLLKGMEKVLKLELPKLDKEFSHIVGYQFKVTQRERCLQWFKQYMKIEDMQAGTIEDILVGSKNIPAPVLRALQIKSIAGSASIKKVAVALEREHKGRIYQNLVYNGAHTKRWAGAGLQVHNFPRVEKGSVYDVDKVLELVTKSPDMISALYEDPIDIIKNILRRIFIPDDGLAFYCGDYSKIEPCVLFWLVGMGAPSEFWYEETAAEIYGLKVDQISKDGVERQLGKEVNLGGGYGMGPPKFMTTCNKKGLGVDILLAEKAINAYRKKHRPITNFWYDIQRAFGDALGGKTTKLCDGKIEVGKMQGRCKGVYIRLPSGSKLYYHDASWSDSGLIFNQARKGRVEDKHTYGGLLTEHVVSATARDIMLQGMFNAEQIGFQVLNTVHDELWAQAKGKRLEAFKKAMITLPKWAVGLSLGVDANEGPRYLK